MINYRLPRARGALRASVALFLCAQTAFSKPAKPTRASSPPQSAENLPKPKAPAAGVIPVTVIEIAGTQAYLEPGTTGGLHRGAKVSLNRHEYTVVQASDSFATILIGDDPPHEKDRGLATPLDEKTTKAVELTKPKALAVWEHAWTEAVPPARSQAPRFVPLGSTERNRRWDVRLSASVGALLPLGQRGSNLASAEIDARVHAEPFEAPVALDLDATVQRWFDKSLASRSGAEARPTLYLRELLASYGAGGYYGGFGRMRYAASTLGALDGVVARAPLGGGLSIGAFGGLLPNPLSGAPSSAASRFGVEAMYSRPDTELRPEGALVVHGSTFGGKVDERRISGALSIYPGASRIGGHFEVSAFGASNQWNAKPIELSAAGFDASVRAGPFQLEGRFDLRQPELSRWLSSYLPATWFCATAPTVGAPPGTEPCEGGVSRRAYGAIDAGVQLDRVSLLVGATTTSDLTQLGASSAQGGFVTGRVVRIVKTWRFDASGSYSRATYLDMTGVSAGPGVTLFGDVLDLSAYYRGTTLQYRSVPASLVQHAVGGTLVVVPGSALLVAVQGEAITGDDTKAMVLFGTITWHPSL